MCNLQQEIYAVQPSSYTVPFGANKGRTFGEVFEENPGFFDWLQSQDWLYFSTRMQVYRFVSQGWVATELNRRFWDEDFRCGGNLQQDVPAWKVGRLSSEHACFIPGEQTTRRFNYGRPSWLKVEWGTDRRYTQPIEEEYGYQWRSAGPQEPARDWTPTNEATSYRDPYKRPAQEQTCNFKLVEEDSDVEIIADEPEEAEDTPEGKQLAGLTHLNTPLSKMAYWDLLADLSSAIDYATDAEDLQRRVADLDSRIKHLAHQLPQETVEELREQFRKAKSDFAIYESQKKDAATGCGTKSSQEMPTQVEPHTLGTRIINAIHLARNLPDMLDRMS